MYFIAIPKILLLDIDIFYISQKLLEKSTKSKHLFHYNALVHNNVLTIINGLKILISLDLTNKVVKYIIHQLVTPLTLIVNQSLKTEYILKFI